MTSRMLMTVTEFARAVGIDARLARKAVMEGQVPSVRLGCRYWVPQAAVDRIMEGEAMITQTR